MASRTVGLGLAIMAAFASSLALATGNVVVNGGFEEGFAGWSVQAGSPQIQAAEGCGDGQVLVTSSEHQNFGESIRQPVVVPDGGTQLAFDARVVEAGLGVSSQTVQVVGTTADGGAGLVVGAWLGNGHVAFSAGMLADGPVGLHASLLAPAPEPADACHHYRAEVDGTGVGRLYVDGELFLVSVRSNLPTFDDTVLVVGDGPGNSIEPSLVAFDNVAFGAP